jgi:hypothetical protein
MIDFSRFESDRMTRLMHTLSGNTDPTEYFDLGRMIEFAWQQYSDDQLIRVNKKGVDLIGAEDSMTYESKCITFKNKAKNAVRGVIVANGYGAPSLDRFHAADYYLFTDYRNMKIAWCHGHQLYNVKINGSTITASANPLPDQFIHLPLIATPSTNFFEDKHHFIMQYINTI